MDNRPIIAVDVDDVLADHAGGFVAFSNERYGTNLLPSDYDEHFAKVWGVTIDEVKRRFNDYMESGVYRRYTPHPQAFKVLRRLAEKYRLIVLTSRPIALRDDTIQWITEHYAGIFDESSIHFAGIWDEIAETSIHLTKADMLRKLGAHYLIDDQVKHCNAAAEAGVTPLLFGEYRWNAQGELADTVVRVSNWYAIEEYFKGAER